MQKYIKLKAVIIIIALISIDSFSQLRPIHIDSLYKSSSFVGIVKVIEGSFIKGLGYKYKAEVQNCFKGDSSDYIEFGIFAGTEIGTQYLVFLSDRKENSNDIVFPKDSTKVNNNGIFFIRRSGFSEMPIKYSVESKSYVIEISTSKVIIPDNIPRYPFLLESSNTWDIYYFKKEDIINYLNSLSNRI